ncbi:hypothetical protein ACR77J_07530 [Tissierella praeacuta]|uniref:hypothetical protein n=1 Tax=Tissierella praeacuta TaxID=43131 RepID=UPI003DA5F04C
MNKRQLNDSKKCEEMQEQGLSMECFDCSCSVCLAQEPTDYKSGIVRSLHLVESLLERHIEDVYIDEDIMVNRQDRGYRYALQNVINELKTMLVDEKLYGKINS